MSRDLSRIPPQHGAGVKQAPAIFGDTFAA
jgi:hypothetical protein